MAQKQPKVGANPGGRSVRTGGSPENFDKQTICWQMGRADWSHDSWGWETLSRDDWTQQIVRRLRDLESMTWGELRGAVGGKSSGTNHHSLPLDALSKRAQARLSELNLDDVDAVFSLRLTGTIRVYGIKDGRVLRVLWYDKYHAEPEKAVCPSRKKNT